MIRTGVRFEELRFLFNEQTLFRRVYRLFVQKLFISVVLVCSISPQVTEADAHGEVGRLVPTRPGARGTGISLGSRVNDHLTINTPRDEAIVALGDVYHTLQIYLQALVSTCLCTATQISTISATTPYPPGLPNITERKPTRLYKELLNKFNPSNIFIPKSEDAARKGRERGEEAACAASAQF